MVVFLLQHCRDAGFEAKIRQEVTPPDVAIAFVGAGAGVALVSSHYQEKSISGVVYRALIEEIPPLEMAIAWHLDNTSEVLGQ
jgi:DNA-binding transcriptional LysR family regulator